MQRKVESCFDRTIDRKTKYAVVAVEQLRSINPVEDRDVVKAASTVNVEMIGALERMVNAAKAGQLEGDNALALAAAAWPDSAVF